MPAYQRDPIAHEHLKLLRVVPVELEVVLLRDDAERLDELGFLEGHRLVEHAQVPQQMPYFSNATLFTGDDEAEPY